MSTGQDFDDRLREAAAEGARIAREEVSDTLGDIRQDPGSFLIFGAVVAAVAAFIGYVLGRLAD